MKMKRISFMVSRYVDVRGVAFQTEHVNLFSVSSKMIQIYKITDKKSWTTVLLSDFESHFKDAD